MVPLLEGKIVFISGWRQGLGAAVARAAAREGAARPSPCTIEDALETSWVAEAATLSLAERRPVRIDEVREPLS